MKNLERFASPAVLLLGLLAFAGNAEQYVICNWKGEINDRIPEFPLLIEPTEDLSRFYPGHMYWYYEIVDVPSGFVKTAAVDFVMKFGNREIWWGFKHGVGQGVHIVDFDLTGKEAWYDGVHKPTNVSHWESGVKSIGVATKVSTGGLHVAEKNDPLYYPMTVKIMVVLISPDDAVDTTAFPEPGSGEGIRSPTNIRPGERALSPQSPLLAAPGHERVPVFGVMGRNLGCGFYGGDGPAATVPAHGLYISREKGSKGGTMLICR